MSCRRFGGKGGRYGGRHGGRYGGGYGYNFNDNDCDDLTTIGEGGKGGYGGGYGAFYGGYRGYGAYNGKGGYGAYDGKDNDCDDDLTTIGEGGYGGYDGYGKGGYGGYDGYGKGGYGGGNGYGNGYRHHERIRRCLLGRSFRHAIKYLRCHERFFRVVAVNGNNIPHTGDYRPNRVDLFLATDRHFDNDHERLRYVWTHPGCVRVVGVAFG